MNSDFALTSPSTAALRPATHAHHRHGGGPPARTIDLDNPHDWFVEPDWAVHALLGAVPIHGRVLDPAAGSGTVVRACRNRRIDCVGSDLVDRGFPDVVGGVDFLGPAYCADSFDAVICNPPYFAGKGPVAFLKRAIVVAPTVALLVDAKFRFSQGRWRFFACDYPPAEVLTLSQRPSMPPGHLLFSGQMEPKGGKADYEWIVWRRWHRGPWQGRCLPPQGCIIDLPGLAARGVDGGAS